MTCLLILARHGQSEGNLRNVFTGRDDPALTDEGREEARFIAYRLQQTGIRPDLVFTSSMRRTNETSAIVARELVPSPPIISNSALNERDYGELTGMNKDEAAARFGARQVMTWRRSYRGRPPGGESLFDARQRVVAYFDAQIAPSLAGGDNVVVVGHGNCLRALAMELEDIPPLAIETFEIATGQILVYKIVVAGDGMKAVVLGSRVATTRSMA